MKRSQQWFIGLATTLSLGLAAATVSAHPGRMSEGMQGGMGHGMHGMHSGQQHGMHAGKGREGMRSGENRPQAAQQLMTPDERTALREKMRAAKTPEERQQLALATRTEMEKRAKDKGITLPEHRGHRGRHGTGPAATTTPPTTTEHAH